MDTATSQLNVLSQRVKEVTLPDKLEERIVVRLEQLGKLTESPTFLPELDRINNYIDWVTTLPWNLRTKDILDLEFAKKVLEKNHYGLQEVKDRLLEYISIMKLNSGGGDNVKVTKAPILCFVGLVGTGKTTIAFSIAEALGRKIARIPFGGMGDPLDLRGQSRMHPEAEPGKIIKALRDTQSKNPVILLDEIDRVTEQGRSSIMGVLVELLDPEQNHEFVDHYLDFPFDLSECLFVATANNTTNISTAVLDRLEPISMPSYSDAEKIVIGQRYVFPKYIKESGLPEGAISVDDDVWAQLVRPLGFDAGIRTLQRTIEGVVRKVARMVVEGRVQTVRITSQNVKEFLPL